MKNYFKDKFFIVAAVLYIITSIVILSQPLFNYLGYEFSALTGILSFIITSIYTYRIYTVKRSMPVKGSFSSIVSESLIKNSILLIIPLSAAVTNMLFVKNCSLINGLLFFALIPCITVLYSAALSIFVYTLFNRFKKIMLLLIFILIILFSLSEYYFNPQLFVYNPFIGFFPGMVYDEELYITYNLVLYRLNNIVQAFILLSFANIFYQMGSASLSNKIVKIKLALRSPVIIFLLAITFLFLFFRNELRITAEKGYITGYLGSVMNTAHFTIYYSSNNISGKEIHDIASLHEFYYYKICRELEIEYDRKIESFIYPDPDTKYSLIGAKYTIIAKPWLSQIHLNQNSIEEVLKHELVHVIAGKFGLPVLNIGRSAALVEGLAMAVEWQWGYRTLHQYSASIFKYLPRVDFKKIISTTGFMASNPNVSYVLSGSFIKYLMSNYGVKCVKQIYYNGDYEKATGKKEDTLIHEWQSFLSQYYSAGADSTTTNFTFNRLSIFEKVCARVIANINEEGNRELRNGNYTNAIELFKKSISLSKNSEAKTGLIISLLRFGDYNSVIDITGRLLTNDRLKINFLPMRLYRADAFWQKAQKENKPLYYDSAYIECSELLRHHINENYDFASQSRMAIITDTRVREYMLSYYTYPKDDGLRLLFLSEAVNENSNFDLGRLLLARLLSRKDEYYKALGYLRQINDNNLPGYFLGEKYRISGLCFLRTGQYSLAIPAFKRALDFIDNDASRNEIAELIERCLFMEK